MPESSAAGVELSVIHAGSIPMPRGYVFRAEGNMLSRLRAGVSVGDDAITAPCLAFAVRHPDAGTILIDTGLHPDARDAFYREFGFPMSLLFRGLRPAPQAFDEQLRTLDIDPARVPAVIMTHLHFDHTSGMRLLPNARFTIARAEWSAARSPVGAVRGYVRHHLPAEDRVELLDLDRDGEPFGPFPRTRDLLGDGTSG